MKTNRIHSILQNPKKCWVCNSKIFRIKNSINGYLDCSICNGFYLINFLDKDGDRKIIVLANKFDKNINSCYNIMFVSNSYKIISVYITYNTPNDSINIGLDKDFYYFNFRKLNVKDYILNIIEKHRKNLIFI